jgi:acetoacetyl-CoA synthetase
MVITVVLATFESLRTILCTGAVLTPPMFEWTQKAFGEQTHLVSTSGGTDICTSCVYQLDSLRSTQTTQVHCP